MKRRLDWLFDEAKYVTDKQLQGRREQMRNFFNDETKDGVPESSVPKVQNIFVPPKSQSDDGCRKRRLEATTR